MVVFIGTLIVFAFMLVYYKYDYNTGNVGRIVSGHQKRGWISFSGSREAVCLERRY